jgi:hypothetical protein
MDHNNYWAPGPGNICGVVTFHGVKMKERLTHNLSAPSYEINSKVVLYFINKKISRSIAPPISIKKLKT